MFKEASLRLDEEQADRLSIRKRVMKFGVSYLDQAMVAILPSDLVLLGAPTGIGKTELCVHMALANIEVGKRVHFIALEAEKAEIERRMLYQLIARQFYDDPNRPKLNGNLNMTNWLLGLFDEEFQGYEAFAKKYLMQTLKGLFTFYKTQKFGIDDLIFNVMAVASETDMIIIDHLHFFDWEDLNDNRAIKEIAKAIRDVVQVLNKPIILVAHLRKRDRNNSDLAPGIDEFHGSSDLTKIATKVITIARGPKDESGKDVTYFRICKNRVDGSITRYIGRVLYDFRQRRYDERFRISELGDKFRELDVYPDWAKELRDYSGQRVGVPSAHVAQRKPYRDDES